MRKRLGKWKTMLVTLVIVAAVTVSCTPGQIEGAFEQIATPFEAGFDIEGVDTTGLLVVASLVLSHLVPGLSIGYGF